MSVADGCAVPSAAGRPGSGGVDLEPDPLSPVADGGNAPSTGHRIKKIQPTSRLHPRLRRVGVRLVAARPFPRAHAGIRVEDRAGEHTRAAVVNSSVGGPLLWPADEPWPHCDGPHVVDGINPALSPADARLERRIQAASRGRSITPQERETLERIRPPRQGPLKFVAAQPYDGSIAMLPVAQLYARDVPDLDAPEVTDLLHRSRSPSTPTTWS